MTFSKRSCVSTDATMRWSFSTVNSTYVNQQFINWCMDSEVDHFKYHAAVVGYTILKWSKQILERYPLPIYTYILSPLFVNFLFFISTRMYFYCRTYFHIIMDLTITATWLHIFNSMDPFLQCVPLKDWFFENTCIINNVKTAPKNLLKRK